MSECAKTPDDVDPFAHDPKRWVGRTVEFDYTTNPIVRASGKVIAQQWAGRTARGAIPDYKLTVEGQSGRRVTISLVEAHCTFST